MIKADKELIPPNYDDIIPTVKPKVSFAINVSLLKKICDAIGTTSIVMSYYGPENAIKITPLDPIENEAGYISFLKTE